MHLLLTDHLICPRCENESGLILLADRMSERIVESGALGCPQCRSQYPIRDGIADLRTGNDIDPIHEVSVDSEGMLRIAALIGVTEGPAFVLTIGLKPESAAELATIVPGLQVVSAGTEAAGMEGVNRVLFDRRIPMRSRGVSGVALVVTASPELVAELPRIVRATGRIVLTAADDLVLETLSAAGARVVAREGATAVAVTGIDPLAGSVSRN